MSGHEKENTVVLKAFTEEMNFAEQSFTKSLRDFLQTFKLPGEAQKIDRLVQSFSTEYFQHNPGSNIKNADAIYVLAFQNIMLNTDLHNPSVVKKMSLNGLKRNLRGVNGGVNFDETFLEEIYDEIKARPFEFNFVKTSPGYELSAKDLNHDITFKKLDSLLRSIKVTAQDVFPAINASITATSDKPKSWLSAFTGYKGTIILKDDQGINLVTIQIYKPSFLSKWIFGEQPRLLIQPIYDEANTQQTINLAAKIAASFTSPVSSIKGTYDYEKNELQTIYEKEKTRVNIPTTNEFKEKRREILNDRTTTDSNDTNSVLKKYL